jgi:hypothetical protein
MSKRHTIALLLLSTSLMTAFSPMLSSYAVTEGMNPTESDDGNPNPQPPPTAPSSGTISQEAQQVLDQEGLSRDIGKTQQLSGCTRSIFKGWMGGYGEDSCTWQLPKDLEETGWVIIGSSVNVTNKTGKNHRSGYGTSFTGSNSSFSSVSSTTTKLQLLIDAAVTKGDMKLAAELKVLYEKVRSSSLVSSSTHNTAVLKVWVQAGAVTRAGIAADMNVTLMKVR